MHVKKRKDLSGQRFGRLTALEIDRVTPQYKVYWKCICDCGNECTVASTKLTSGWTKSCGCLQREVWHEHLKHLDDLHGKHHESGSKLYKRWQHIKQRCNDPNHDGYKHYGSRGISVCEDWVNSYESFRDWSLANGFDESKSWKECSLDRIDPNGDYCPENCRWVDMVAQNNNKRNNVWLESNGERHTIAQWSRILGVRDKDVRIELKRRGNSAESDVAI